MGWTGRIVVHEDDRCLDYGVPHVEFPMSIKAVNIVPSAVQVRELPMWSTG